MANKILVTGAPGKYFADMKEKTSNPISHDTAVAQRLWQISAELTGRVVV